MQTVTYPPLDRTPPPLEAEADRAPEYPLKTHTFIPHSDDLLSPKKTPSSTASSSPAAKSATATASASAAFAGDGEQKSTKGH